MVVVFIYATHQHTHQHTGEVLERARNHCEENQKNRDKERSRVVLRTGDEERPQVGVDTRINQVVPFRFMTIAELICLLCSYRM